MSDFGGLAGWTAEGKYHVTRKQAELLAFGEFVAEQRQKADRFG